MKHINRFSTLTKAILVFVALVTIASSAFAASDYLLKIEDVKGESKIVSCPNGTCSVEGLAPGTYSISLVDAKGKAWLPSNFRLTSTFTVASTRDAASGQATGKSAIQSPRDAASGLPTGKRMHKPMVITKELDKSTPLVRITAPATSEGEAVIKWTLEVRVDRIEMK